MLIFGAGASFLMKNDVQTFEFGELCGRYIWERMKNDQKGNYRWRQCRKAQKIYDSPKIDVVNFNFSSQIK